MSTEFTGSGAPLTPDGLQAVAEQLGVGSAEIWAVLTVETSGCGFLPDRRPKILFERHIFHRETNGRFDTTAPDLSHPERGGYGPSGAHQHDRLARAMALDRRGALRSASWGIGQVMGFNAEDTGYADVEAMVQAMGSGENEQLRCMFQFVQHNELDQPMRRHDWEEFAKRYNGPAYKENHYDEKLAEAFARHSSRGTPDLRLRAAQVELMYRGFDPRGIDGVMGNNTRAALRRFQESAGLSVTSELDPATAAELFTGHA